MKLVLTATIVVDFKPEVMEGVTQEKKEQGLNEMLKETIQLLKEEFSSPEDATTEIYVEGAFLELDNNGDTTNVIRGVSRG